MHPKPNKQIKYSLNGGKIRLNNILCLDHFRQVGQAVTWEKSATHNNHRRQFTIHLNGDWT